MGIDFSGAPQDQGGELIPEGTLAWGVIHIQPKSAEFGKILNSGRDNPENKYFNYMVEWTSEHVAGRKTFGMIAVEGSEKWVNMSMAAIRHILEVGRKAGPDNPQGYVLGANLPDGDERMWMEIDGLQVAAKIGVEYGNEGHRDKNRVSAFLSPNPDSPTNKHFVALLNGATMAEGSNRGRGRSAGGGASANSSSSPWMNQSGGQAPSGGRPQTGQTGQQTQAPAWGRPAANAQQQRQPAGNSMARPAWTGSAPPQSAGNAKPPKDVDDDIPY